MMHSADLASVQAIVHGYVQGVFFRDFASRRATELGLAGYVLNQPGGIVEVYAEGERNKLEQLISYLHVGPPAAKVKRVVTNWSEYTIVLVILNEAR